MNKSIEKISQLYKEAFQIKEKARKPNADVSLFRDAVTKFEEAVSQIEFYLNNISDKDSKVECLALAAYYLFEKHDCLYAVELKAGNYDEAIEHSTSAKQKINKAISIIDDNIETVNEKTKDFLTKMRKDWAFIEISIEAKLLEPKAKEAFKNEDYISSFDYRKSMLNIQKKSLDYCKNYDIDPVITRITMGNYFAAGVNLSQMYAGIVSENIKNNSIDADLTIDLLKHFVDTYEMSIKAFNSNPEWNEYREGQEKIKSNIIKLLRSNRNRWMNYLIELEHNNELVKIMKNTDMEIYKNVQAKFELENSPIKKFYLTEGFYLMLFIVVAGTVFLFFTTGIPLLYKPLAVFSVILLFSIVGAFVLRSTNNLSEENFLILMKMTFHIGLKGLDTLNSKVDNEKLYNNG